MPLSINLFREEKGGDLPTLLKSQKARGAPDSVVNGIIAADKEWRQVEFDINQINRNINAKSKEIGQKKKVTPHCTTDHTTQLSNTQHHSAATTTLACNDAHTAIVHSP